MPSYHAGYTAKQSNTVPEGTRITVAFDTSAKNGGRWYWQIHTPSVDKLLRDVEGRDFHSLTAASHHLYMFLRTRRRTRHDRGFYDMMDRPECTFSIDVLKALCASRKLALEIKGKSRSR